MIQEAGSTRQDEVEERLTELYGPRVTQKQIDSWRRNSAIVIAAAEADVERAVVEGNVILRDPGEAAWTARDPEELL